MSDFVYDKRAVGARIEKQGATVLHETKNYCTIQMQISEMGAQQK